MCVCVLRAIISNQKCFIIYLYYHLSLSPLNATLRCATPRIYMKRRWKLLHVYLLVYIIIRSAEDLKICHYTGIYIMYICENVWGGRDTPIPYTNIVRSIVSRQRAKLVLSTIWLLRIAKNSYYNRRIKEIKLMVWERAGARRKHYKNITTKLGGVVLRLQIYSTERHMNILVEKSQYDCISNARAATNLAEGSLARRRRRDGMALKINLLDLRVNKICVCVSAFLFTSQ